MLAAVGRVWSTHGHLYEAAAEGGERRMVQMHSEDILILWKSQMIGNDLVVFIQI